MNPNPLHDVIEQYLKRGFGSMNKNDFEVFLFGKIIEFPEYKGKSNYELSVLLRIPETKIKRLRYESALKNSNLHSENDYKGEVKALLQNAHLRAEERKIMFQVEDVMLKMYISSILKKDGRVIDHSFNDEVLVIRIDDYEHLLNEIYGDENVKKELQEAKRILKKENITWEKILEWTIQGLVNGVTGIGVSSVVNLTLEGIKAIIPHLTNLIK